MSSKGPVVELRENLAPSEDVGDSDCDVNNVNEQSGSYEELKEDTTEDSIRNVSDHESAFESDSIPSKVTSASKATYLLCSNDIPDGPEQNEDIDDPTQKEGAAFVKKNL